MSPSSWTATAAGPRRAACRASRAIGAASRRCARPCAPPASSASACLTIFSFSSENWQRPASEVRDLMGLLRRFIRNDLAELHGNGVRVRVIGERDDLDPDIRRLLEEAEELTRANTGLMLVVAFNYGARDEIARAVRRIAEDVASGALEPEAVTEEHDRTASRRAGHAPIPISSSAPAASSGCRISCSGRRPIRSWCSCRSTGRTSTAPRSKPRSTNTAGASAASAGSPRRPGRESVTDPADGATGAPARKQSRAAHRLVGGARAARDPHRVARRVAVRRCSGSSPRRIVLWEWVRLVDGARPRLRGHLRAGWRPGVAYAGVAAASRRSSLRRDPAVRLCRDPVPVRGGVGRPTSRPISPAGRSAGRSCGRRSARRRPGPARSAARSAASRRGCWS